MLGVISYTIWNYTEAVNRGKKLETEGYKLISSAFFRDSTFRSMKMVSSSKMVSVNWNKFFQTQKALEREKATTLLKTSLVFTLIRESTKKKNCEIKKNMKLENAQKLVLESSRVNNSGRQTIWFFVRLVHNN